MLRVLVALLLAALATPVLAVPHHVSTFHSIGLYWSPPQAGEGNPARVRFRIKGTASWREGLPLWFDARNAEYRGSLVELRPGTAYEIELRLASGALERMEASTWSETFRIKRTVTVERGTTRLVIEASDSGSEREGYVLFTAAPGRNVIDQSALAGNQPTDSCVVVRQGAQYVIIRGLVLRNCRRHGVYIERQFEPVLDLKTQNIVIEDNEILGWGGSGHHTPGLADDDGAVHCNYWRETDNAKKPDRVVIQRNRMYNPRHGANPWQNGSGPRVHPQGPQAATFTRCGSNHVLRYNEIYSTNQNHFNDGFGGSDNFSAEGFPWADSDLYGNRISQVYDDAIEAEGGNRNVRIWGNYFDRVFVAIANAATAVGPLYVWRNVSNRMAGMYHPESPPDAELRGQFIKAGSPKPAANGGRAYYFHNTVLQPAAPGVRYAMGAGGGINNSAGKLYNFVSRNNIWHIHKDVQIDGQAKFDSLRADADRGPVDVDFDLYNGRLWNVGRNAQKHGWKATPVYASRHPGDFTLKSGSPGHHAAERIPNFNDQYPKPDVGAHQSGTPPMQFGVDAYRGRAGA